MRVEHTLDPAKVPSAGFEVEALSGRLSPLPKSRAILRGNEVWWRKRVRVEHTLDTAKVPSAGFEDREDHRIPFASVLKESKRNLVLFQ